MPLLIELSILLLAAPSAAALAQPAANAPIDVAAARASLIGDWQGTLEYLDYTANEWFGIPVTTRIEDRGDGATIIRKSDFDHGPQTGMVRITSVELFDASAATVTTGVFRKGREAEVTTYKVRIEGAAADAAHWTMTEEVTARDDGRPATLRLTTVRDGEKVETLKQVDFLDDAKTEWISRNRTRLTRAGA
jgi:hypothetical protein